MGNTSDEFRQKIDGKIDILQKNNKLHRYQN